MYVAQMAFRQPNVSAAGVSVVYSASGAAGVGCTADRVTFPHSNTGALGVIHGHSGVAVVVWRSRTTNGSKRSARVLSVYLTERKFSPQIIREDVGRFNTSHLIAPCTRHSNTFSFFASRCRCKASVAASGSSNTLSELIKIAPLDVSSPTTAPCSMLHLCASMCDVWSRSVAAKTCSVTISADSPCPCTACTTVPGSMSCAFDTHVTSGVAVVGGWRILDPGVVEDDGASPVLAVRKRVG